MKKIILFRHAMATNFSEETLDHDRILAQRGIADAQKMGRYLKNKKDLPEYVISSSAIRA